MYQGAVLTGSWDDAAQAIKKETGGEYIECVLHDGAPNVGGAWASEAYSQSALVLEALQLATDVLAPKGNFVTKIFRWEALQHMSVIVMPFPIKKIDKVGHYCLSNFRSG